MLGRISPPKTKITHSSFIKDFGKHNNNKKLNAHRVMHVSKCQALAIIEEDNKKYCKSNLDGNPSNIKKKS